MDIARPSLRGASHLASRNSTNGHVLLAFDRLDVLLSAFVTSHRPEAIFRRYRVVDLTARHTYKMGDLQAMGQPGNPGKA
ncbi:hypothetical protein K239x_04250 [Planctomycetes bacterium K23_9]|uniref:Uncharacterized protein n=1 Tax=Stieleria marina TaxID=1930275 RepID=A0A517NMY0_9BACT|nr:hypothetical protein K239x_04250 [Planctomycetes bacterium K23_9]